MKSAFLSQMSCIFYETFVYTGSGKNIFSKQSDGMVKGCWGASFEVSFVWVFNYRLLDSPSENVCVSSQKRSSLNMGAAQVSMGFTGVTR